jgi:hypothetical protein
LEYQLQKTTKTNKIGVVQPAPCLEPDGGVQILFSDNNELWDQRWMILIIVIVGIIDIY